MIVVVDASVAVKWFLHTQPDEDHTEQALKILEQSVLGTLQLRQPPHFIAEIASVLVRLKPDAAHEDLSDLIAMELPVLDTPASYAKALDLAMRYQHHLFDTLYHAVALQTPGATLITADQRYYDKAKIEGQITLLSDWIA